MRRHRSKAINAIVGVIVGEILFLPFLAWPAAAHAIVAFPWTESFMAVGALWGCLCGVAIPSIAAMERAPIRSRVVSAAILGGISGLAFYIVGDLAFQTADSLATVLLRSLWGWGIGALDAMFCIFMLRLILYGRRRNLEDQAPRIPSSEVHGIRARLLSSAIAGVGGSVLGGALFALCGQLILYHSWQLVFWELFLLAPLVVLLGTAAGIYAFIKPMPPAVVDMPVRGLSNGVTFSVLSVFYIAILLGATVMTQVPKPELLDDDFIVPFVMGVAFVYTFLFGWIAGTTGGLLEGILMHRSIDEASSLSNP